MCFFFFIEFLFSLYNCILFFLINLIKYFVMVDKHLMSIEINSNDHLRIIAFFLEK